MTVRNRFSVRAHAWHFAVLAVILTPGMQLAQTAPASPEVTFAKDIARILQAKCQQCHQPNGVAPMSLVTYEDLRVVVSDGSVFTYQNVTVSVTR